MRVSSAIKPPQAAFFKQANSPQVKSAHSAGQSGNKGFELHFRANAHTIAHLVSPETACPSPSFKTLQNSLLPAFRKLNLLEQKSLIEAVTQKGFESLPKEQQTIDKLPLNIQDIIARLR